MSYIYKYILVVHVCIFRTGSISITYFIETDYDVLCLSLDVNVYEETAGDVINSNSEKFGNTIGVLHVYLSTGSITYAS